MRWQRLIALWLIVVGLVVGLVAALGLTTTAVEPQSPQSKGSPCLALAIGIDTSGSMAAEWEAVRSGYSALIDGLKPCDRVFVFRFDAEPRALTPRPVEIRGEKGEEKVSLKRLISSLKPVGAATRFEPIFDFLEAQKRGWEQELDALLLLTDGVGERMLREGARVLPLDAIGRAAVFAYAFRAVTPGPQKGVPLASRSLSEDMQKLLAALRAPGSREVDATTPITADSTAESEALETVGTEKEKEKPGEEGTSKPQTATENAEKEGEDLAEPEEPGSGSVAEESPEGDSASMGSSAKEQAGEAEAEETTETDDSANSKDATKPPTAEDEPVDNVNPPAGAQAQGQEREQTQRLPDSEPETETGRDSTEKPGATPTSSPPTEEESPVVEVGPPQIVPPAPPPEAPERDEPGPIQRLLEQLQAWGRWIAAHGMLAAKIAGIFLGLLVVGLAVRAVWVGMRPPRELERLAREVPRELYVEVSTRDGRNLGRQRLVPGHWQAVGGPLGSLLGNDREKPWVRVLPKGRRLYVQAEIDGVVLNGRKLPVGKTVKVVPPVRLRYGDVQIRFRYQEVSAHVRSDRVAAQAADGP